MSDLAAFQNKLISTYGCHSQDYPLYIHLYPIFSQMAVLLTKSFRFSGYPDTFDARSVPCDWVARELGISTLALSKRLGISQPTASQSVKRGEKIIKEKNLKLLE
jgi:hypothetical protein